MRTLIIVLVLLLLTGVIGFGGFVNIVAIATLGKILFPILIIALIIGLISQYRNKIQ